MPSLIPAILQLILPTITKIIPDPAQQAQAQAEITKALMEGDEARFNAIRDVILAETQAGGINALWRPLLALFYLFLMAWSWVLVPVINAAFAIQIWTPDATTIASVGGLFTTVYGLSRSLEKGISINGR